MSAASLPEKIRNAPYLRHLVDQQEWKECVEGLEAVLHDHPAMFYVETTFYVGFHFIDGAP